jgi:hypothetical protein
VSAQRDRDGRYTIQSVTGSSSLQRVLTGNEQWCYADGGDISD